MNIIETDLPGVLVIEPRVFADDRGHFFESFNLENFGELTGVGCDFVQDNQSLSREGVLRGLHYQVGAHPQGKLVRVLRGEIRDVAVDLRTGSEHFARHVMITLSAENRRQLWIPPGFAHGFLVTSPEAEVFYKTTDYWHPECERTVAWNDESLGIDWGTSSPVLSDKDRQGARLVEAELFA